MSGPVLAQAYLTTRKQNKKFAVFDLSIVLDWKGTWEEDGKEVSEPLCMYLCCPVFFCTCCLCMDVSSGPSAFIQNAGNPRQQHINCWHALLRRGCVILYPRKAFGLSNNKPESITFDKNSF